MDLRLNTPAINITTTRSDFGRKVEEESHPSRDGFEELRFKRTESTRNPSGRQQTRGSRARKNYQASRNYAFKRQQGQQMQQKIREAGTEYFEAANLLRLPTLMTKDDIESYRATCRAFFKGERITLTQLLIPLTSKCRRRSTATPKTSRITRIYIERY
ncbi:uncharacterized protein LOC143207457 [Lasioglossum baleicum]|uniref:uncharacterized protein LOC143207457 n=1 Tax=Lasioglossum baleicum TaxID=434251 RepID=UPI003FCD1CBF